MNDGVLKIGVIAVGGAGISMVSKLRADLPYLARFIAIDINKKALNRASADIKILVGDGTNRPRRTDLARFLAQLVKAQIVDAVAGLDVVFLVAGMGGVAGSALSLTVADLLRARPEVLLSIGVPITPFAFEGQRRQRIAAIALNSLANRVDCLIPLRNEALAEPSSDDGVLTSVLEQALVGLRDIYTGIAITLCEDGFIGVDFDDIKMVLKGSHVSVGVSTGRGVDSALLAREVAFLLIDDGEISLHQATGVWVVLEGQPPLLKFHHLNEITNRIKELARSDIRIGFSGLYRTYQAEYSKISIYCGRQGRVEGVFLRPPYSDK